MEETTTTAVPEQATIKPETQTAVSRVTELESLVGLKDSELSLANNRIIALEQGLAELNKKLEEANNTLSQTVASYRALVVRTNPLVMEELISGDSIEAINTSLERAKAVMARVRQGMEEEAGKIKVPAGAPQRTFIDVSTLSPREKIQYAIGGKK